MTTRLDTELRLGLNAAAYTRTRQGLESISQSLGRVRREVLGFVTGFASLRGGQELARLADQANTLRAKLRLVTAGQAEFNEVQRETLAIAQRTSTPLGAIVEAYERLLLPMQELKREQGETLDLTEVLAKGFALEGSSAEEAAGKIERFAMALTQGEVNAAALNSIALESPALMQALAAGLNVPIMKLRELAKEGKLTAEAVVDALLSQKEQLAQQYAQLPTTVGQAMTKIQNQFMVSIGEIDRAAGATAATVRGLVAVADNMRVILEGVGVVGTSVAAILLARLVPSLIAATAAKARAIIISRALAAEMGITAGAATTLSAAFSGVAVALTSLLQLLAAAFVGFKLGEYLRDNFKMARDAGYAFVGEMMVIWERLKQGFKSVGPLIVVAFAAMADKVLVIAAELLDDLGKLLAKLPAAFGGSIGLQLQAFAKQIRSSVGEGAGKEALADIDRISAEAEANIQRIRDEMADLVASPMSGDAPAPSGKKKPGKTGGGGLPADNLESFKAELKRIEAELEASFARRQITEKQYLEARLDLELIGIDREIKETEKKRAKARGDEARALEQHVGELKAKRVAAEAQALAEIQQRESKSLEERARLIEERLARREERVARDRQLGKIGEVEAKTQVGDARADARKQLDDLITAAAALEGQLGADTVERLKLIRDGLGELKSPLQELGDDLKANLQDPLADAFTSIIKGTKSAKEAFRDFGQAVIDIIIRIIAQKLAAQAVSFFSGGGAVGLAGGGPVSGPGGPTDDKIPAMLSDGEYVLQASAVKRWGRGFLDWLNNPAGMLRTGGGPRTGFAMGGLVQAGAVSQAKQGQPILQINMPIDARGADAESAARMMAYTDRAIAKLRQTMFEAQRRGYAPV